MDLTQLANLGEFIGGVAVLVTLVYLAMQVRQGNKLARADAFQRGAATYSSWRHMLADEGINAIWVKAHKDEDLSPEEEQRLYVVVCEMTYAHVAAMSNNQAAGNQGQVEITPLAVARELRSRTMLRVWSRVAEDLETYAMADFAAAVTDLLHVDLAKG